MLCFVWLTIYIDCLWVVLAFESNINTYYSIPPLIPICRHWLSKKYNFEVKVNQFTNNTFVIKLEKFQRRVQAWRNIFCTKILMDEQANSVNWKNILSKKKDKTKIFLFTASSKITNPKVYNDFSTLASVDKNTISKTIFETNIFSSTTSNNINRPKETGYSTYNKFSTLTTTDKNIIFKKNVGTISSTTSNEMNRLNLKDNGYLIYNKFSTLTSTDKHYSVYSKKCDLKNYGMYVFWSSTGKVLTCSRVTPYLPYFIHNLTVPNKSKKNSETISTQIWYNTNINKKKINTKQNIKHWLVTNPLTSTLKYNQNKYLTPYNIRADSNKYVEQKCITTEKRLKTDEFWHVTSTKNS